MSLSRVAGIFVFLGCLLGLAVAVNPAVAQSSAQSPINAASTSSTPSAASTEAPAILPQQFAGWQMQGSAQTSTNAAVADPTNAAVLKEYRFTDFASSTYTRDDGRTLKIRAARFADASGAFGAYTFYLQPEMNREEIGDQGSSLGPRVLFYRGYVLVDAQFSKESPMSASELRELAGVLPRPRGSLANLPGFIDFMPHRGYVANTQKYVMGPAALATMSPPISADLVDFGASSEVTLGRYNTDSGEATLMLISYPTNQMAADHLRRIDPSQSPKAGVAKIACTNAFCYKRTGPFLAIAAGPASNSDVKSLLGMVNYEATVTWNENTYFDKSNNIGALLVNIIILCFILGAMAIVAGVAFGGFRILMKRWFPDKIFDRPEQMEFISLHLTEVVEVVVEESGQGGPEGIRQTPQNPG
jgi:hypothetical protein